MPQVVASIAAVAVVALSVASLAAAVAAHSFLIAASARAYLVAKASRSIVAVARSFADCLAASRVVRIVTYLATVAAAATRATTSCFSNYLSTELHIQLSQLHRPISAQSSFAVRALLRLDITSVCPGQGKCKLHTTEE